MSFIRAATFARSAVTHFFSRSAPNNLTKSPQAAASRRYTTETAPKKAQSNLPLYLISAGTLGLGGYIFLNSTAPTPKKAQEKSPLDPQNFLDFKLKRVVPYNHNTATCVPHVLLFVPRLPAS